MKRRVVITGIGAVTPLGIGKEVYWRGLIEGKSGVTLIDSFDCSEIATRIAAQIRDFDPEQYMERKEAKRMDRFTQFAVAASKMAFADSHLTITEEIAPRVGTYIGSGIGGISTLEEEARTLFEKGMGKISPFFVPMMIANMGTGRVARLLNAQGPSETIVTACATSTNAVGEAFRLIARDDADAMIAGGAEAAVTPLSLAGFSNMRALSRRNDEPTKASRPFDEARDGFVLGEGAGILILEELEFARRRGAPIYAEIIGYGMSNDAYDMVAPAPEGRGAAQSMRAALRDAQVRPEEIDYINPHATSTPVGDIAETQAMKQVFGEHARRIAISATKSMTGHLLGAAGAIEAIATVLALQEGILPPTINLENPDLQCDLDYVPNVARRQVVHKALSNSFGFGGHNATLVLTRYEEGR
ncbi:MAG TPA: beta-ketoacyl-ACP synthase II [Capsulimonadaceae bacterium]|nr:beta-ketoacyl-ACP synthase II [Capsulimonadaceae bacterium]